MPLYRVKCPMCLKEDDIYRSFDDYENTPYCCGGHMKRVICAPMVMGDIHPYISQIDGRVIHSRSDHRAHLKAHGCIEVGNEKLTPKKPEPPKGLKETIIRITNEKLH